MSSKWTGARAATPRDGDERKERNEPSGNHRRGAAPFYSYENRATRRWDDNRSRRGDVSRSDLVPSEASMLNFSYGERGPPFGGETSSPDECPVSPQTIQSSRRFYIEFDARRTRESAIPR